jgi:hypothetical protein
MNIEINFYRAQKRFEEYVREKTALLATLKSKKVYKYISLPRDTAEIGTGMAKKSSPRPGKQTAKTGFGLEK